MSIIKTNRNWVYAYEPLARDAWVQVLIGSAKGVCYPLTIRPIACYRKTVEWAVAMADRMEFPIQVVPLDSQDFLQRYGETVKRGVSVLSPEEADDLCRMMVNTCAEVMRDSNDPVLRASAYDVLVKMGVVPT